MDWTVTLAPKIREMLGLTVGAEEEEFQALVREIEH